ncbi:MAG: phosphotransferase family protein [Patulibacter sp.]|nr:phosphotransferase family protein [Patulibacter sp.]
MAVPAAAGTRPQDLSLDALVPWMAERLEASTVELTEIRRHAEGFSWGTYTFTVVWTDAAGTTHRDGMALRREPEAGLLPPYDTRAQYVIHEALLEHSTIPMPALRWLETGHDVLGMPFYVMDRVTGHVPVPWGPNDPIAFPTEEARVDLGHQFVDLLAELHHLDPADLGMTVPSTDPVEAARHEIAVWRDRYEANLIRPIPILEQAFAWLDREEHIAVSGKLVPTHGDYRIGNFMIDDDRRINALFDWELAHASDPIEDLAWSGMRLFRGKSPRWSHLLEYEPMMARYTERTGTPVTPEAIRFWTILCYVKASANYVRGSGTFEAGGSSDLRLAAMGHQLTFVLRLLQTELREAA